MGKAGVVARGRVSARAFARYEAVRLARAAAEPACCRISERSSHTWFVLRYLLGLENVRNYDGSRTECNLVGATFERP